MPRSFKMSSGLIGRSSFLGMVLKISDAFRCTFDRALRTGLMYLLMVDSTEPRKRPRIAVVHTYRRMSSCSFALKPPSRSRSMYASGMSALADGSQRRVVQPSSSRTKATAFDRPRSAAFQLSLMSLSPVAHCFGRSEKLEFIRRKKPPDHRAALRVEILRHALPIKLIDTLCDTSRRSNGRYGFCCCVHDRASLSRSARLRATPQR